MVQVATEPFVASNCLHCVQPLRCSNSPVSAFIFEAWKITNVDSPVASMEHAAAVIAGLLGGLELDHSDHL